LIVIILLLVPIVPFLVWGARLTTWANDSLKSAAQDEWVAALSYALLASDIVLPVPSSLINTFAGAQLGWWQGTLVCWAGMSTGAVFGFALARAFTPLAQRFMKAGDRERMREAVGRWGWVVVVSLRGLPILAEASVLLAGIERMPWRTFLPAVLLSNLVLAAAYSLLGAVSRQQDWLPAALLAAAAPALLAIIIRRQWRRRQAGLE
jgi:uncharacterized membrane protein YdjX (TVP38/TMEM64 family)